MTEAKLEQDFKELEDLGLERRDVLYSSTQEIPMTQGVYYDFQDKELIVPVEQLELTRAMIDDSLKSKQIADDVHPLSFMYGYHTKSGTGSCNLRHYLKEMSDEPEFWIQNTRTVVDDNHQRRMSVTVDNSEFLVTTR